MTRFLDLHLNKRLSKQARRWWFETASRSLWRHCNYKNIRDWWWVKTSLMAHAISVFQSTDIIAIKMIVTQEKHLICVQGSVTVPTVYLSQDWLNFIEMFSTPKIKMQCKLKWRRHQMETIGALPALCAGNSPVIGEFPSQRPMTRSYDVFFHLRLNDGWVKQSWGWWFETPSRSLWRNVNECSKMHWYMSKCSDIFLQNRIT